jgi:hypothetical protein
MQTERRPPRGVSPDFCFTRNRRVNDYLVSPPVSAGGVSAAGAAAAPGSVPLSFGFSQPSVNIPRLNSRAIAPSFFMACTFHLINPNQCLAGPPCLVSSSNDPRPLVFIPTMHANIPDAFSLTPDHQRAASVDPAGCGQRVTSIARVCQDPPPTTEEKLLIPALRMSDAAPLVAAFGGLPLVGPATLAW